jgi:DEAD/DEAH box helicase domain-containing protein
MRAVTFDIETANAFPTLARGDFSRMEISIVGVHDSETGKLTSYAKEEFSELWPIIERADLLIGFNSDSFDIPLLNRYYPGDLTRIRSLDLLTEVYNVLGRRIRLQSLAEATLGESKSGSGLDAVTWWQQGEYDKVRQYCMDDVKITRQIYDYALKHGKLKYNEPGGVREFKIDTSHWKPTEGGSAITHTLPF